MELDKIEYLTPREKKIAKHLLKNNIIANSAFDEFLARRKEFETSGKKYLGDILISGGQITPETLNEFLKANNRLYLDLLGKMVDDGFLTENQYEEIIKDQRSKDNVVQAIDQLNIMTRESFVRFCSSRINLFKLGEWLVVNGRIKPETLERALNEQKANSLEEYLVHNGLLDRKAMYKLIDDLRLS